MKIIVLLLLLFSCKQELQKHSFDKRENLLNPTFLQIPSYQFYNKSIQFIGSEKYTGLQISLKSDKVAPLLKFITDTSIITLDYGYGETQFSLNLKKNKNQYIKFQSLDSNVNLIVKTRKNTESIKNTTIYIIPIVDSTFVNIKDLRSDFIFDIAYATENNFTKSIIYNCAECLLRWEVAKAILDASIELDKKGYRFLFYDCYRPVYAQKLLWAKVPNPTYVANPYTKGSIHSRGAAVDISMADSEGWPLDMGTAYDFFGQQARHEYVNFNDAILANRNLLKKTMEGVGFNAITSEWWHYSFKGSSKYSLSNTAFDCDE